jgi:predicted MPP superfamily phosphohydrolase
MYHRPDGLEAAAEAGLDLMLSGHTHNGQIYPFSLLVRSQFSRICGRYQQGDTTLYVSPGTGTWGPVMRLGSANEVTLIELSAR